MTSIRLRFPVALAGVCALIVVAPPAAPGADKDMVELQREMALIGEQINNLQTLLNSLQTNTNQKLGAQGALLQQTLDLVNQIHTQDALAVKALGDQLNQQGQKTTAPLADLNAKLDQMITQFSTAQENISDMTSRLGRLEQRLVDVENAVKTLQPPPGPQGLPPGTTAQGLYQSASGDQLSGKYDLALQEYKDYLKYFGDTETAAAAQFHVGEILLAQGNVDDAVEAFDTVAGEYPRSSKAPDALYLKAQALKKEGKRTLASQALNQLVRLYPDSDAAGRAKAELPAARAPRK
jgi:tol-pal system protein YbgF